MPKINTPAVWPKVLTSTDSFTILMISRVTRALSRGVRDGLWTGIGLVLGLAGALALTRLMATLLFGVSAYDGLTLASAVAILGSVGLLASYLPAARAAKVDPARGLRNE